MKAITNNTINATTKTTVTAETAPAMTAVSNVKLTAETPWRQFKGNLLKAPQVRITKTGKKVVDLDIAYNPVDQNGVRIQGAEMIPYRKPLWGADARQAELLINAGLLKNGSFVAVEGWENIEQNGQYTNRILKGGSYTLLK